MSLTREEALKIRLSNTIINRIESLKEQYSIPRSRIKEAFIETLLLPKFNSLSDYNARSDVAIYTLEKEIESLNPMQLRDKYCYPVPIERELVLGYAIVEIRRTDGSSFIELRPVVSTNTMTPDHDCGYELIDDNIDTENGELFKGFINAPFPTYRIEAYIDDGLGCAVLGYEHPTLTPRDWTNDIVVRIKKAIENSADEQDKAELSVLIKDFV